MVFNISKYVDPGVHFTEPRQPAHEIQAQNDALTKEVANQAFRINDLCEHVNFLQKQLDAARAQLTEVYGERDQALAELKRAMEMLRQLLPKPEPELVKGWSFSEITGLSIVNPRSVYVGGTNPSTDVFSIDWEYKPEFPVQHYTYTYDLSGLAPLKYATGQTTSDISMSVGQSPNASTYDSLPDWRDPWREYAA